jgi:hypothetical protein
MARKLACLFYRLIKCGQQYVDKGMEYYEAKHREQQIRSPAKRAQKLGLQLVVPGTAYRFPESSQFMEPQSISGQLDQSPDAGHDSCQAQSVATGPVVGACFTPTQEAPSDNQVTTSRVRSAFWGILAIPGARICYHLRRTAAKCNGG